MAPSDTLSDAQLAQVTQIRTGALAAVSGEVSRDSSQWLSQLEALELPESLQRVPICLEARVLAIVAHGRRPRRAQKPLYRLWQIRSADGQGALFTAFQDILKSASNRGVSVEGISFIETFATLDHDAVWKDTGAAIDHVQRLIGPAFLNSGTLLGAIREKAFIAHDDDVDLAVILPANTAQSAGAAWIDAYHSLHRAGLIDKPPKRNYGVFKLVSETGVNVDLFPAWIEEGRVYVYPHTFGDLAETDVLPLGACTTSGLPIPAQPEKMLAVNYGEGWREPDPSFSFPWGKANRKFAEFRAVIQDNDPAWEPRA